MTELETRLVQVLQHLSQQVEGLEKRLTDMTGNYQVLSKRMDSLSALLADTGTMHNRLMTRLDDMERDQHHLETQLKAWQTQWSAESGKP
jgi:chaperonin cofactor prefoldin